MTWLVPREARPEAERSEVTNRVVFGLITWFAGPGKSSREFVYIYIFFQGVRSRSRGISTSLSRTSSTKFLRLKVKWCMQNIAKTDINSPGSMSQQERHQERPLKAAKNHRQACLNAETKEQRQANLEVGRGTTA